MWYEYVFYSLLALLVLLTLIILIKTLTFKDKTNYNVEVEEILKKDVVVTKLAKML